MVSIVVASVRDSFRIHDQYCFTVLASVRGSFRIHGQYCCSQCKGLIQACPNELQMLGKSLVNLCCSYRVILSIQIFCSQCCMKSHGSTEFCTDTCKSMTAVDLLNSTQNKNILAQLKLAVTLSHTRKRMAGSN